MTKKIILITGSTDGIGLETAKKVVSLGHRVLLHGRSAEKLKEVLRTLSSQFEGASIEAYVADLSRMSDVEGLAQAVISKHAKLDILINNAGVFATSEPLTPEGIDVRFTVNTLAPFLLVQRLLPIMDVDGRVINLSSAAQSRVDLDALRGKRRLADGEAYAQSKLAITMWSRLLSTKIDGAGPAMIAVNPGSFLGSKMVREAYGRSGRDLGIGANILTSAALDDEFADANGQYFDNDTGRFASPHPDALDDTRCGEVVKTIESLLSDL